MKHVVFVTPGLIDLKSITMFGMNAKPNTDNPIGYFGTGLKYAIATLLRKGCEVVIWRGKQKVTFYTKEDEFRGHEFDSIVMKHGFTKTKLPFSLQLGKNWQLWEAFRELYSNTIDEQGEAFVLDSSELVNWTEPGNTYIIVAGDDFVAEYYDRGKTFLEEGLRVRQDAPIQIIPKPSKHVYYRGLRVYDLEKPSTNTYNILSTVELTEDRTVKSKWSVEWSIKDAIIQSNDADVVRNALRCTEDNFEHGLNFNSTCSAPSDIFKQVYDEERTAKTFGDNGTFVTYMRPYRKLQAEEVFAPVSVEEVNAAHELRKAIEELDWTMVTSICSDHDQELIKFLKKYEDEYFSS